MGADGRGGGGAEELWKVSIGGGVIRGIEKRLRKICRGGGGGGWVVIVGGRLVWVE